MKKNGIILIFTAIALFFLCAVSAFAITESEVQAQVDAHGREAVSGNVFIWFICAIAFLKISQKIDSFMSGLGINVGHTGGNMLAEAFIAARGVSEGRRLFGIGSSGRGLRGAPSGTAGANVTGSAGIIPGGLAGVISRRVQGGAVYEATGQAGSGLFSGIGSMAYQRSLDKGGDYANNITGAVARGSISQMGTITGDRAADALTSYFGGSVPVPSAESPAPETVSVNTPEISAGQIPHAPQVPEQAAFDTSISESVIVSDTAGVIAYSESIPALETTCAPSQQIHYSEVEIGGGRITGYEESVSGGEARQFAMYAAEQYTRPEQKFETLTAVDGSKWYRQYTVNAVEKTPYKAPDGRVTFSETIIQKLPAMPKRKDRV